MTGTAHRQRLAVLVAVGLAVGTWGVARSQADVVDLAVVTSQDAVSVVDTATGDVTVRVREGVPSPDGSVLVRASVLGDSTLLRAIDTASGLPRWRREVAGQWAVRLVAGDGDTVVLGAPGEDGLYTPVPRARTRLLVSWSDERSRHYHLAGNYEPEAVALDGSSVFVISYLPPTAPDRYQVRRLDLVSGEVLDVFTPDAHLQEEMGGTARKQVWSPDGRRLYTLYTLSEAAGVRAFVHVLDLEGLWAHCIDLPDGMAVTDEAAVAMAVGEHLYVADRALGTLAEVDTARLSVTRVAEVARMPGFDATAALAPGGGLFLGAGSRVEEVELDELGTVASWRLGGSVAGLHPGRGGTELVAVLRDRRMVVLDVASGEQLRRFDIPGDLPVEGVGGSAKRVPGPRDTLDCAC